MKIISFGDIHEDTSNLVKIKTIPGNGGFNSSFGRFNELSWERRSEEGTGVYKKI